MALVLTALAVTALAVMAPAVTGLVLTDLVVTAPAVMALVQMPPTATALVETTDPEAQVAPAESCKLSIKTSSQTVGSGVVRPSASHPKASQPSSGAGSLESPAWSRSTTVVTTKTRLAGCPPRSRTPHGAHRHVINTIAAAVAR